MAEINVLVAQGGGPTAVINQSLTGVVLQARRLGAARVLGARHGVRGLVDQDLLDLGAESAEALERVAATPSSALGSTRDKPDAAYCREILRVLQAHRISHFVYIGGNDSADTVRLVAEQARADGVALRCVHVPKTIDNDLVGNDHTPGYPSAARFVAQAFAGADLDNAALPGIYLGVVMGRHAGFLTAAAALARQQPDDGPHLVYLPERVFSMERFLADVQAVHARLGRCVVAVSEGIHDASGAAVATQLAGGGPVERDAHGNVQLSGTGALADALCGRIKQQLGFKRVRGDTFGYLQRSFLGCVSDVDRAEARAAGERAIDCAVRDGRDGSVVVLRRADPEPDDAAAGGVYAAEFGVVPLADVAAKTRTMEDRFIAAAGNDVTAAFGDYLRPLLGILPVVARLQAVPVPRRGLV